MKILPRVGYEARLVADSLEGLQAASTEEAAWTGELRESAGRMATLMQGPVCPAVGPGAQLPRIVIRRQIEPSGELAEAESRAPAADIPEITPVAAVSPKASRRTVASRAVKTPL